MSAFLVGRFGVCRESNASNDAAMLPNVDSAFCRFPGATLQTCLVGTLTFVGGVAWPYRQMHKFDESGGSACMYLIQARY